MNCKVRLIFLVMFILWGCAKPKIELICEEGEEKFHETYLVTNPPDDAEELNQLIRRFNKDLDTLEQYGQRIFLKPHDNRLFDSVFPFHESIDYSKNGCEEIDNMDILIKVSKYKMSSSGMDMISYYNLSEPESNKGVKIHAEEK